MRDETEPAAAGLPAIGPDGTDEGNGELSGWAEHASGPPGPEAGATPDYEDGPGDSASARPATGEPRVDAALKLLDRLPGLPVGDHPELFEQVHAQLTEVLGELDSGPGNPAGPHGN